MLPRTRSRRITIFHRGCTSLTVATSRICESKHEELKLMRPAMEDTRPSSVTARASKWSRSAFALLLVATLGACKDEAKVEQEIVRPVKVAVVAEQVRGSALIDSVGVHPPMESDLGFRVPGKIAKRTINVGDPGKVDQAIARRDDADRVPAENSAKAAVPAARRRRDVAKDNLERGNALL